MPANILNLPQYRVLHVENAEHDYHIWAEPVTPVKVCPHCESLRLTSWGSREQLFKDLPMHGKRVSIHIDTKRLRCQTCHRTFSESLPALAEARMMTERLFKWIGQQSLKCTFTSLANETGVVEGTIRNIFRDHIDELEQTVRFETPKWMGIDDIHIINKPRCVISNTQDNTIVDMLQNRNKDTVAQYLFKMPDRDEVQYVAMAMWTPYRDAVKTVLPDARIVIDRFHVIGMANDAMERARKGLRSELTPKQKRGLTHDRFVLLKHERDLDEEERLNLDGWIKNYPALGEAHRLKEGFYSIYDADSPDDAYRRYEQWYRAITPEMHGYFADLTLAWDNWQPYILNYFEHLVTNAHTESLNSLIRIMNRLGRGYSFEALRAKILFTEGIHSNKQARPKFERKRVQQPAELGSLVPDKMLAEFRLPSDAIGYGLPPVPRPTHQHDVPKREKNYGADIATLIRMIEAGEL